jgi:hypothetical protein
MLIGATLGVGPHEDGGTRLQLFVPVRRTQAPR